MVVKCMYIGYRMTSNAEFWSIINGPTVVLVLTSKVPFSEGISLDMNAVFEHSIECTIYIFLGSHPGSLKLIPWVLPGMEAPENQYMQ